MIPPPQNDTTTPRRRRFYGVHCNALASDDLYDTSNSEHIRHSETATRADRQVQRRAQLPRERTEEQAEGRHRPSKRLELLMHLKSAHHDFQPDV